MTDVPVSSAFLQYCELVLALKKAHDEQKAKGLHNAAGHIKYLYRQSFYGFFNYLNTRCYASKAAIEVFQNAGNEGDLRDMIWSDQPRFDRGRELLISEHIFTGYMFRRRVEELDSNLNADLMARIVSDNFAIAWILRDENGRLPKQDRGLTLEDALRVYEEKGIELVRPDH